jgi:hypothetical protein
MQPADGAGCVASFTWADMPRRIVVSDQMYGAPRPTNERDAIPERGNAMSTMEKITVAAQEYEKELQAIDHRREQWLTHAKGTIKRELEGIARQFKFDWRVEVNETARNFESVYLAFGKSPSGIEIPEDRGWRALTRNGAALVYSLGHDGRVAIWISFGYVENVQEKPKEKVIFTLEPHEIAAQAILLHVEKFLWEIVYHERKAEAKFGFR